MSEICNYTELDYKPLTTSKYRIWLPLVCKQIIKYMITYEQEAYIVKDAENRIFGVFLGYELAENFCEKCFEDNNIAHQIVKTALNPIFIA